MSFFKIFRKAQEKMLNKSGKSGATQEQLQKAIIKRFYADYPETPYISADREKEWIERATLFPEQSIIPKEMMIRFENGLLPGHIYMLYWLKRYTNKRVPVYFEYKYGVDFEKEKLFLKNSGFLNDSDKPTEEGEKAIADHYSVVEKHAPPKPDKSIKGISEQIPEQRATYEDREEYEKWLDFINKGGTTEQWESIKKKRHHN